MTKVLYGKDVAAALSEKLKDGVSSLAKKNIKPVLAIVRVGENPSDLSYERGAVKRCDDIGVGVLKYELPADITESALLNIINEINSDDEIHGCLIFRPLPAGMDENRIANALLPEKDVDGITDVSMAAVFNGSEKGFSPCTAEACIEMLGHYGYGLEGKKAVIVGRSLVVGKPVAMMALRKNATVVICHSRTADLPSECQTADILIVATGAQGLLDASYINPKSVIIDVGINVDSEGKICGDIRTEDAKKAAAYSPVPGGVGAMTTTILAKHVIEAAKRTQNVKNSSHIAESI